MIVCLTFIVSLIDRYGQFFTIFSRKIIFRINLNCRVAAKLIKFKIKTIYLSGYLYNYELPVNNLLIL